MLNKIFWILIVLVVLIYHAVTNVNGQSNKIQVRGIVKDINGGAVAGAKVKFERRAIKFEQNTIANERGEFEFINVAKGLYQITVSA